MCLLLHGFPLLLEDLSGGTAATVFLKSLPPLSLSGESTGSTAVIILLGAYLELCMCQHVSAYSAVSLASSLSIFFATWLHRSPGSLRRKRCLNSRPAGSQAGRHAKSDLISCVGACLPSSGA